MMRYSKYQKVEISKEHQSRVFDCVGDLSDRPVEIELKQRIHDSENPFLTYWEVEYIDGTSEIESGERLVLEESLISTYEVISGMEDKDERELVDPIGV